MCACHVASSLLWSLVAFDAPYVLALIRAGHVLVSLSALLPLTCLF